VNYAEDIHFIRKPDYLTWACISSLFTRASKFHPIESVNISA